MWAPLAGSRKLRGCWWFRCLPTASLGEDFRRVSTKPQAAKNLLCFPFWRGCKSARRRRVRWESMRFGTHLRELSRLQIGVALSAVLAAVAALWSVDSIGLLPPRLTPRELEMATAYTQVMIDTPKSALLDLGVNSDGVSAMTNRALVVGTLVASPPVVQYISHRAGVPVDALQIQAPSTPANPAPRTVTGRSNGPVDLLRPPGQYRLDIYADPVVPFLDIYAQAATVSAAGRLANGAVDGLSEYLRSVAASQGTSLASQVQLRQFGRAQGKVINKGVNVQVAMLTFLFVFAIGCATTVALGRIRRGWRLAAASAER